MSMTSHRKQSRIPKTPAAASASAVRRQTKSSRSRTTRTTAKGREIVASLREAIEVEEDGVPIESRFTVRTVDLPDPASTYDAAAVRTTRGRLGVSQTIFAQLLGVSPMLVRAWEQGQRSPAMWARRLLDEVNRDPRHWLVMLRRAS
jgi:putative transcriptional regulator